jgi:sporulation protein YlmC with PRC-barrel domain
MADLRATAFSGSRRAVSVRRKEILLMNDTSTTRSSSSSNLIDSRRIEGTELYDTSGKHIGSVKSLVLDKVSGRVVYVVASFGGFLGIGADTYTIPWNALKYDTSLGGYVTNITPEKLRDSPAFARNNKDDDFWSDRKSEQSLYDYSGATYYWVE